MPVFPEKWRGICLEIQGERRGGWHKHKIFAHSLRWRAMVFMIFPRPLGYLSPLLKSS